MDDISEREVDVGAWGPWLVQHNYVLDQFMVHLARFM